MFFIDRTEVSPTEMTDAGGSRAASGTFAFVSDVHSNLEALRSVLAAVGGLPLYCLGDTVGYGASPNEVVELLRERGAVMLMGNHDYAAVTGDASLFNARAAIGAKWTLDRLTSENRKFLGSLPTTVRTSLAGVPAFLTHGSPDSPLWEYVDPSTHEALFGHYLTKLGVKICGVGHTHLPFVWRGADGTVFNPGSVGQPRDGDWRASYALVTVDGGEAAVSTARVEYDASLAARKILDAGLPEQFASRLVAGR